MRTTLLSNTGLTGVHQVLEKPREARNLHQDQDRNTLMWVTELEKGSYMMAMMKSMIVSFWMKTEQLMS